MSERPIISRERERIIQCYLVYKTSSLIQLSKAVQNGGPKRQENRAGKVQNQVKNHRQLRHRRQNRQSAQESWNTEVTRQSGKEQTAGQGLNIKVWGTGETYQSEHNPHSKV